MKNLKIILGVAVIAALMTMSFASCGEPEPDPDAEWTVTWDLDPGATGGFFDDTLEVTKTETVGDQATLTAPTNGYAFWTPTAEGLYPYKQPSGWKNGTKDWDFTKDKVTENITLKAQYSGNPTAVTLGSGTTIVDKAVAYVTTANAKPYILALNGDYTVSGTKNINIDYFRLYILGLSSERKITAPTAKGRIFVVGKDALNSSSTISLTLGNNVTLNGIDDNNAPLVLVQNGATLTMLTGSKVAGNKTVTTSATVGWPADWSTTNNYGYGVAGVHVDAGTLSLEGGQITGNTNNVTGSKAIYQSTDTKSRTRSAGGVYVESKGFVNVKSGTISLNGNSGSDDGADDIYVTTGSLNLTLGGAPSIGEIGLEYNATTRLVLDPTFTGTTTPIKIFLAGTSTDWLNKIVISGYKTLLSSKFSLQKYLPLSGVPSVNISGSLGDTGKLTN